MADNKSKYTNPKINAFVYTYFPKVCPFCDVLLKREKSGHGKDTIKYDIGFCGNCKRWFTSVPYYLNHIGRIKSVNPERTKELVRDYNKKLIRKNQIKMAEKENQDNKMILFDKVFQSFSFPKVIKSELIKNAKEAWMKKSLTKELVNSIIVAYLIRVENNYSCYFISRFEIDKTIRAGMIGIISMYSRLAKKIYDCDSNQQSHINIGDKRYDIVGKAIVNKYLYINLINSTGKPKNDDYGFGENKNTVINRTQHHSYDSSHVYVYFRLTNSCIKNKHSIDSVTAKTTNIKNGQPIDVNVFYCKSCRKYFINYEALQGYISRGIHPALQYVFSEVDDGKLNDASELMMYGYNVREGDLTQFERRRILEWIIDYGLMTKAEIISNLQFKVGYNGKKPGNERAKQKWLDDIQFVSRYVNGNSKTIKATFVFRNS